jgi:Caspase domain
MLRIAAVVCLGFSLLCSIGGASAETEARRIALVIGNADYKVKRLNNPRNDARLVAQSLQAAGFSLINGRVQLDLDNDSMRDAIRAFGRQLSPNTVAVLYYSGHGIEYQGENYLVPIDADPDTSAANVELDLVNVGVLLRQIEAAHNGMTIVILDACRTNPFTKGLKDVTGGLAQLQAPRGTLVAFATQPGHSALDGTKGNSPYALALADEIRKPGLDVFNTFNEIARKVDDATQHQQTPWFSSSPIAGEFYFVPPASQPTATLTPQPMPPAPVPSEAAAPTVDPRTITQLLQAELRRVGCYSDTVTGVWDRRASDALGDFNKYAHTNLDVGAASLDAIKAVSARAERVCPLICPRGQTVVGDRCTAVQSVRTTPAAKPVEPRNAPATPPGKRCDTWAGQTYCE